MNINTDTTEDNIIKRCQEHDMGAYKTIYQQYEHSLLRTSLRILGHLQDAEDAVQTTFLKLYRGIKNFRFDSKFSTYLFRILINTCFDILKKKKRMKVDALNLDKANPAYHPEPEIKLQLEQAVEMLPQRMRACFVLFAVEEFKQEEIAKIMGLSLGGVKSNIFQAKARLRATLSASLKKVKP